MKKNNSKVSINQLQQTRGAKITPLTKIVFIGLLAVALVAGIFAIAASISKANELPEQEKVVRTLSGKSLAEDREQAVAAVKDLLESTNAPKTITEAGDTITELENGDLSSFKADFQNCVRYYDSYEKNSDFQTEVAMGVYSIAALAKEVKEGELTVDQSLISSVKVDQEAGIAQVPITLFTGNDSPIAFEMVYTENGWQLEPHTFTSYIRLSAMLQAN